MKNRHHPGTDKHSVSSLMNSSDSFLSYAVVIDLVLPGLSEEESSDCACQFYRAQTIIISVEKRPCDLKDIAKRENDAV